MASTDSSSNPTDPVLEETFALPTSQSHLVCTFQDILINDTKDKEQVEALSCAVGFTCFPQLPLEIRQMIWKMALTTPQIYILTREYCSPSRINTIMRSCTEAQDEGLKLKLPYYIVRKPWPATEEDHRGEKNYVNWGIDTFWTPVRPSFSVVSYISLFCRCCVHTSGPVAGNPKLMLSECEYFPPYRGGIAVNLDDWNDDMTEDVHHLPRYPGAMRRAWILGDVRHIYIVINKWTFDDPDVEFVEPTTAPPSCKESEAGGGEKFISWKSMAEDKIRRMEAYKVDQQKWRTLHNTIDKPSYLRARENLCCDLSDWVIPSVSYVEARSSKQK